MPTSAALSRGSDDVPAATRLYYCFGSLTTNDTYRCVQALDLSNNESPLSGRVHGASSRVDNDAAGDDSNKPARPGVFTTTAALRSRCGIADAGANLSR